MKKGNRNEHLINIDFVFGSLMVFSFLLALILLLTWGTVSPSYLLIIFCAYIALGLVCIGISSSKYNDFLRETNQPRPWWITIFFKEKK